MDFDENQKFSMQWHWPMTLNKMAAFMHTNEIWAYVEVVLNSNFAHQARLSHVNMLCIINKYRLLNALAEQKGEILFNDPWSLIKFTILESSKEHMQSNTLSIEVAWDTNNP